MAINPQAEAAMLAFRRQLEDDWKDTTAAITAAAPELNAAAQLTAEMNAEIARLTEEHDARVDQVLISYRQRIAEQQRGAWQAQEGYRQAEQRRAAQQAHDAQMQARALRLAAEERERAEVAEWQRRRGAA